MIKAFYANYPKKLAAVRAKLGRPLTLTEKLLFVHLYHPESLTEFKRGQDYIELRPDRAGTHDIGGPMAILQFLTSGKERIALPAALVADLSLIHIYYFDMLVSEAKVKGKKGREGVLDVLDRARAEERLSEATLKGAATYALSLIHI